MEEFEQMQSFYQHKVKFFEVKDSENDTYIDKGGFGKVFLTKYEGKEMAYKEFICKKVHDIY